MSNSNFQFVLFVTNLVRNISIKTVPYLMPNKNILGIRRGADIMYISVGSENERFTHSKVKHV